MRRNSRLGVLVGTVLFAAAIVYGAAAVAQASTGDGSDVPVVTESHKIQ
jgi:hypothetical protein